VKGGQYGFSIGRKSVKKLLPPQAIHGILLGMWGLVRSYVTLAINGTLLNMLLSLLCPKIALLVIWRCIFTNCPHQMHVQLWKFLAVVQYRDKLK
jgi:hypothetical protein